MKKEFETIIIGGGMSGIGCARTLAEKGQDFLLISKDIGGRVLSSSDRKINYGAFYVRSDYHHILPFVKLQRKITINSTIFERGNQSWSFWNVIFKNPVAIMKLYLYLIYFDFHYQKFKNKCTRISQIEALHEDVYLEKMHAMRASDFLKKHNLNKLISAFVDPIVKSTAFLDVEEMPLSAAGMLLLLLIGLYRTNEFEMQHELLTADISDKILKNEVISIVKNDKGWVIKTNAGDEFVSKNLVVATPIDIAKKLLHLDININHPISVHMAHLRGELLETYKMTGNFILFSTHKTQDIVISKGDNSTYLFYSHNPDYDLSKYFKTYEVIVEKFWHPAFFIGHEFISCSFSNNLFVIGDHNIVGMEDSYITGVYAGNRINMNI